MPKRDLTVVMLTWNRRWFINNVLYNLFRNDFPFKTVIIDNASTDGTREYLLKNKQHIDELILNDQNVGCVAFNEALRHVEGEYVSIQADDHILAPNWLKTMYAVIKTVEEKIKDVGYVSSIIQYAFPLKGTEDYLLNNVLNYELLMNNPKIRLDPWAGTVEAKTITKTHKFGDIVYQEASSVGNGGAIIPMRTFRKIGLFRTYGLRGLYDGEFRSRCMTYGLSVGYTPNMAFIHMKENFLNPERVKQAYASINAVPQQKAQMFRDIQENIEWAKRGIPSPSIPKL